MKIRAAVVLTMLLGLVLPLAGQTSPASQASVSVPPVIQFSNIATDETGALLGGNVSITFSLYNNAQGGAALWTETQNVQLDGTGHYTVYLGITQSNGIPVTLFTSGEAHWLGVKIAGQAEQQPRTFLVSVPYAMKAGDAATVGGLPPSAFVLAAPGGGVIPASAASTATTNSSSSLPPTSSDVTTSGGTVGSIPLWDAATDIDNSAITQTGSGTTAKIGINTTTPASTLDVKGGATIRGALSTIGTLSLPATGTATSSLGKNSEQMNFTASAYNSGTSAAVNQVFQWQAEPVGNDTSTESATLNLLFGQGTSKPAETGLSINSLGQITFAPGQTFSGSGSGTVTSVASGLGLTGGPITSSGTLQIDPTVVPQLGASSNTFTGSITASSFTGNGAGLMNVNAATLNGVTAGSFATLSANTFTGTQTISTGDLALNSGNLDLPASGVINMGGVPFAFGAPYNSSNLTGATVFLGFTGNTANTGVNNTAIGYDALQLNTVGNQNVATGAYSLQANTRGYFDTASGYAALNSNTSGTGNTALGTFAGAPPSNNTALTGISNTFLGAYTNFGTNGAITNATAVGAAAQVTQNNSLVLGSINGVNLATANTSVGIGTTAPGATLDVEAPSGSAPTINFGNSSNPATFTVNGTSTFTGNVNFQSTQTFPGVAELTTPNTFTANQTVNGNFTVESSANPTLNIGTSSSAGTLDLFGVLQIGGSAFGYGSASTGNAYLGFAGNGKLPSGSDNTAIGGQALNSLTSGGQNTAVGNRALFANTTGGGNTATGAFALPSNSTGSNNTASGWDALLGNTTGGSNTATGASALQNNTTGVNNTASGAHALSSNKTGIDNTAIGYSAGTDPNTTNLSNATAVGAFADVKESNALVLGSVYNAISATSNVNVGIGTTTPAATLDVEAPSGSPANPTVNFGSATNPATFTVNGTGTFTSSTTPTLSIGSSTTAGTLSLYGSLLIGGTAFDYGSAVAGNAFVGFAGNSGLMPAGTANTAVGFQALTTNASSTSTGSSNTAIGDQALLANSGGSYNTAIGFTAMLENTSGSYNTASGVYALFNNSTGSNNTASGYQALASNSTNLSNGAVGSNNTASGYQALYYNSTGFGNAGFGSAAGYTQDQSQITGANNSFFGSGAGLKSNFDANGNVINNATAIGAGAVVAESNAIVLGNSVDVGIGTIAPASTLDVEVNSAAPATPQVIWLKNNAAISSNTPGNSVDIRFTPDGGGSVGTPNVYIRAQEDGDTNFGTSLQFATVNDGNSNGAIERMRITSSGLVGIGTAAPDDLLSVNGSADKPGGGSWGTFSDRRLKNLDGSFNSGLRQIMKISPVLYRYKEENAMGIADHQEHVGVVAQDVQKVIPEAVSANSKGYLLVNNDPIIWAMLNAIKEQQKLIQRQQERIEQLSSQVKTIQTRLKTNGRMGSQIRTAKADVAGGQR